MEDAQEKKQSLHPLPSRANRIGAGLFVIAVGMIFLMERLGVVFPGWLFTWPVLLIALGIFIGIRHNFRSGGWIVLILVGGIFLANRIYGGEMDLVPFLLPAFLILAGLVIAFRPRRHREYMRHYRYRQCRGRGRWRQRFHERHERAEEFRAQAGEFRPGTEESRTGAGEFRDEFRGGESFPPPEPNSEDFVESVSVFGGSQKSIFSKNFKGGDLTAIFGGNELNLAQADFTGTAVLEVVNIFGGTTIVVPANWHIKHEMVNIFGGTDDKRVSAPPENEPSKVLILNGLSIFGGVEIKSF